VNTKLLAALDYESPEPGIEKLSKDARVVAKVKGENPVTVAELTESLLKKFFHGTETETKRKKINARKDPVLEEILLKRITLKEARTRGFQRSGFLKNRVEEYRKEVLFGIFVEKAIDPDIRVEESEGKTYYQEHLGEYTTPEMIRIDGIAFTGRQDAEDAIGKLRNGADFQWMRANAEGRADATNTENLMGFGGSPLLTSTLPKGLQMALTGADAGDYRIYEETGGTSYVLLIREVLPSRPQPYETVKEVIERRLFLEKRQKAFRDWEEKLRKASDVKIYVAGENLDRIVRPKAR
jgi:hypothetical protein